MSDGNKSCEGRMIQESAKSGSPGSPVWHKVLYHIFSDYCDQWTDDYSQAKVIFNGYVQENGCARLYRERYTTKLVWEIGDYDDEACLLATGEFPL